MQPKLELLSIELTSRILDEAFQLLMNPGIRVLSAPARELLAGTGAEIDSNTNVVRITERTVRDALDSTPKVFHLFNRLGECTVTYGGNNVHFDPGSSSVNVLDPDTLTQKPARTEDLIRLVKVAEMLPQYDAQSTAVVCDDVPKEIGDLYRLYVVLMHSIKPIVTGSFTNKTLEAMIEMVAVFAGSRAELASQPQAIFDVCPNPPLTWGRFAAENIIALAREGMPAEIVSMPLAGAAAPVTLLGAITQHAAECLSGITIHQLARPGSPIVWGGAPAIFDMRKGTTPMGAMETAMIDAAYAQVGKSLDLPTHCYLGASDAKVIDAQAGLESGVTAIIGALAGVNMISGAGMLDFLACQSPEKLVVDAEAVAMAKRLLAGVEVRTETLATGFFEGLNFKGDFLKQRATRDLFSIEQYLPSNIIDRDSVRGWQHDGSLDTFSRAKIRTAQLIKEYHQPQVAIERQTELNAMVEALALEAGMATLPTLV
jgi:trimethylamine--corrinoid protein Co-methyltransferase